MVSVRSGIASPRPPHADPQAQELLGAELLHERAEPVVAGKTAASPRLQAAGLQVDVVVDDQQRLGLDLEEAHGRRDGTARLVHVRLRLEQRETEIAETRLRQHPRELRAPRAALPPRELVEDEPAQVVARALVLATRVAETRDQQVERRGALAPTKKAHQCPVR